jgi:hypothetical protein
MSIELPWYSKDVLMLQRLCIFVEDLCAVKILSETLQGGIWKMGKTTEEVLFHSLSLPSWLVRTPIASIAYIVYG